jgi:hypothetical protein
MTRTYASPLALVLCAAALAACGGGGDDNAGTPSVGTGTPVTSPGGGTTSPTYNVAAAWHNALTSSAVYGPLTGTGSDNRAYVANISLNPQAGAAFPLTGAASGVQIFSVTYGLNGGASNGTSTLYYYDTTSDQVRGVSDTSNNTCATATAGAALPTAAAVDASGTLFTTSNRSGCAANSPAVAGTSGTATWAVRSVGGVAFFCVTQSAATSATLCVQMDTDGTLRSQARLSVDDGAGFTLTAAN